MDKYVPKPDLEEINAPPSSPVRDLLFMGLGVLSIVAVVMLVLAISGEWLVSKLPPAIENKIFGGLSARFGDDVKIDPELQRIFDKLKAKSNFDLNLSVSCDSAINAFALPGGSVVVTSGLINKMNTEKGMAFVLAHEIGHFYHRHHLKGLGRSIGFTAGALVMGMGDTSGLSGLFSEVMSRVYSRDQEANADDYALDLIESTYGNLYGTTEFFDVVLVKQTEFEKYAHMTMMTTHPMTEDRIAKIKQRQRQKMVLSSTLEPHMIFKDPCLK